METRKKNTFPYNKLEIGIVEMLVISAKKNKVLSWEMKVYQALLLVGQLRLVINLGVQAESREELDAALEGSHVRNSRKLLFRLSDSLSSKDSQKLACHLKGESTAFLEIVYLELIKEQQGNEVLCPRVLKAIHGMGSADLEASFLKLGAGVCSCPKHAQEKIKDTVVVREFPDTEFYRMVGGHKQTHHYHPQGPGLCVIVNQKTFSSGLQDRLGTDRDRDELEATFTLFQVSSL